MSSVSAMEAALADGADDVLPWPCPRNLVAARLRSVAARGTVQETQSEFIQVLAAVVAGLDAREPHRVDHSVRVSGLCVELGRRAGIPATEAGRLRQAALIYDLGKVSIPDQILWKHGALTADEMALVRSHPVVGSEMLHGVSSLEPLLRYVVGHHERIDGSGYPYGLRGGEIPVSVQILGLADEYEALVSSRPYRARLSHSEAMAILAEETRLGQFDPALVALLEEALPAADLEASETSETDGIRGTAEASRPVSP
jgi:putative two-component system response regulator